MLKRLTAVILLVVAFVALAGAQSTERRRVTPVKPATNTTLRPAKGTPEEVIERYMVGDTAEALAQQRRDSLAKVYPHYPLLTQAVFGANVGDALFAAFGQKYGSFGVSAGLNMWNRLTPSLELGLGYATNTAADTVASNQVKLSPYAKLGVDYNFVYKSTPKYQGYAGLRLGWSALSFGDAGEKTHATWAELVGGLRVQLIGNLSAGWQVRFRKMLSCKDGEFSAPRYVPGFGSRSGGLSFAISFYYTLPLSLEGWPKPAENTKETQK